MSSKSLNGNEFNKRYAEPEYLPTLPPLKKSEYI